MIRFRHSGSFKHTESLFNRVLGQSPLSILKKYGQIGVEALAAATPRDSGNTASQWNYDIEYTDSGYTIHWTNSNVNKGVNIAVILQYGHGTGTGGYVSGIDYINPALAPVFEQLAEEAFREVTSS